MGNERSTEALLDSYNTVNFRTIECLQNKLDKYADLRLNKVELNILINLVESFSDNLNDLFKGLDEKPLLQKQLETLKQKLSNMLMEELNATFNKAE